MRLIILGPPGAGKGTQAGRIAAEFGIPAISTGDIFRANIKNETELGRQVKDILASGGYVTDEITNAIVRDRLREDDAADGFLLDGYPRTLAQVDALDAMLAEDGHALDAVLELTVDEDAVVQRLLKRAEIEGRADDTEEVIRERQAIYLALISLIPLVALVLVGANQNFPFGGTSILIIVGVGLETVKQIESQLQQRHYEGFLR